MNLENTMLVREASHEGHVLCDSVYMKCPEQANACRQKVDFSARAWGEEVL